MREAAVEFIKASVPKVPVDTGMARGSFLNMARALNRFGFGVTVDINPARIHSRKKPLYYYTKSGERLPKTPQQGAKLTEYALGIEGNKVIFSFKSNVIHYALMDFYNVKGNGPWGSMEAGMIAFRAKMKELKGGKIGLAKFLTKYKITGRGGINKRRQDTVS